MISWAKLKKFFWFFAKLAIAGGIVGYLVARNPAEIAQGFRAFDYRWLAPALAVYASHILVCADSSFEEEIGPVWERPNGDWTSFLSTKKIRKPANTMILGDTCNSTADFATGDNFNKNGWGWSMDGTGLGYVKTWHSPRNVNVLFADGHAVALDVKKLYQTANKCRYYYNRNGQKCSTR